MIKKDLIAKIKELKQIKPRKDWVVFTKRQILDTESSYGERFSVFAVLRGMVFQPRMAYALVIMLGLFISAFGFAQNSLPGDLLYPLKRIAEKSQAIFVSEAERPKTQLELTNKRLEELTKIAQENQTSKLAPAIDEFQKSAAVAAKNLKKPQKITKEIVDETKKLLENKEKLTTLGVVIGETEELDNALNSLLIKSQIQDLEKRSLSDEQKELLREAKEFFIKGDLEKALEKVLQVNSWEAPEEDIETFPEEDEIIENEEETTEEDLGPNPIK